MSRFAAERRAATCSHLGMLMDRGHRQARGEQIQPTDALLEGRVHGRLSAIAAIEAHRQSGPAARVRSNQTPERGTRDTLTFAATLV